MAHYNPYDLQMHIDPYPNYKQLRDEDPLHFNEDMGFWALTRFDDIWRASRDWETFSSSMGPTLDEPPPVPMMIAMDPPDHNRNRGLISQAFTPRAIQALEQDITDIVCRHLDKLVGTTEFDAIEDFAARFPMDVISTLLGIPESDRDEMRRLSNQSMEREPGNTEPPPASLEAIFQLLDYFSCAIADRRKRPRDDMMSQIIHATIEDDNGNAVGLSEEELLGFFMLLNAAGNETMTKFIGNGIVHLSEHPEFRREIGGSLDAASAAVEELLRYDPPAQYQGRVLLKDLKLYGKTARKGQRIALVTGAAGRDDREFDEPDRFDIHRKIPRQLGLGYGQHLCLGHNLARMESRIALHEFHKRFPDYRINRDNLHIVNATNVKGYSVVPVTITH